MVMSATQQTRSAVKPADEAAPDVPHPRQNRCTHTVLDRRDNRQYVLLRSAPCRPLGASGQIRARFPTIDHPGDEAHDDRQRPVAQREGPPGLGGLAGLLVSGQRH
jgi:hypothetical protein